ncbi:MAG TPA: capsular biosynthesis protein CpsI, partial [Planctomycetaceae bacterium]|nr:capsular biosynthesis protein CpsI [Planctomycetaceae bacterium]
TGDVLETYADISELQQATGFTPSTSIEQGIDRFVDWYLAYHSRGR